MCNQKNNTCCCAFTIISSLLIGIGIAAIFFGALLTSVTALLYVTLVLGILSLLTIIFKIFCSKDCDCLEDNCLLVPSTVGAIISSIFGLVITLATASIPSAILVAVIGFFLTSLLISLIEFLICTFCGNRRQYCNPCNN